MRRHVAQLDGTEPHERLQSRAGRGGGRAAAPESTPSRLSADALAVRGDLVATVGTHAVEAAAAADGVPLPVAHADDVATRAGGDAIVARTADEQVPAATAREPVIAGVAELVVVARLTVLDVIAGAAGELVVSATTVHVVVALVAAEVIVALMAVNLIVAAVAVQLVVGAATLGPFALIGALVIAGDARVVRRFIPTGIAALIVAAGRRDTRRASARSATPAVVCVDHRGGAKHTNESQREKK
jgi:hypothetical protein